MICHHITIPRHLRRVTIPKSSDSPAFVVGPEGQDVRCAMTDGITITPAEGPGGIEDLFDALLDVWEEHAPGVEPVLVYADFGDDTAEGFAALVPSEEGWEALHALGAREFEISDLENRPLTPLQEARRDRDHWRSCCRKIDAICDEHNIPVRREDGSRIYAEDRVRLLVEKIATG